MTIDLPWWFFIPFLGGYFVYGLVVLYLLFRFKKYFFDISHAVITLGFAFVLTLNSILLSFLSIILVHKYFGEDSLQGLVGTDEGLHIIPLLLVVIFITTSLFSFLLILRKKIQQKKSWPEINKTRIIWLFILIANTAITMQFTFIMAEIESLQYDSFFGITLLLFTPIITAIYPLYEYFSIGGGDHTTRALNIYTLSIIIPSINFIIMLSL